jgi:hypothetical protein
MTHEGNEMSSDSLNLAQNLAYTALQKPPSAVTPNVSHPATVSQAPHSPTQPQKKQTPFPILPILAGAVAVVSGALFFLYQRGKHVESLERKAKPLVEKLDQVVEDVKEDVLPKKDGGSKSKHRSSTTQHNTTQPQPQPQPQPKPQPQPQPQPKSKKKRGINWGVLTSLWVTLPISFTGLGAVADQVAHKGQINQFLKTEVTTLIEGMSDTQTPFVKLYSADKKINYSNVLQKTQAEIKNYPFKDKEKVTKHLGASLFRMFETQARYNSQYASIAPVKVKTAVIGNELESVIAAIAASKNGSVPVVLIRQEAPDVKLGGLITNSGQTHLDRDFNFQRLKEKAPGLYHEIISQAGTSDFGVDIDPKKLESVLEAYIKKHNIVLVNGEKDLALSFNPNYTRILNVGVDSQGKKQNFSVIHVIDTSPKGSVFERSGHWDYGTLKDLENYGTTLRKQGNDSGLLAVSAIPKINISYGDLDTLDLRLRKQGVSFKGVSSTVKFEDLAPEVNASEKDSQKSHLVGKAIGSDFVKWMYTNHPKEAGRLKLSNIEGSHTSIQGFNLSEVEGGKLNFNGILFLPDSIQELTSWNNKPNAEMLSLLNRFKEYLNLQTKKNLNLETPKQLYVREFGSHFATSQPVTLQSIAQPNNSDIFTSFQYANDFRGQYPKEIMRGLADESFNVLKPVLQLDLNQGLSPCIDNLMGVSQSIGSTPSSQGIYRIQQNLSYRAELLGQRSALTINPEIDQVNRLILQKSMQERGFKTYKINPLTYRESELDKALASESLLTQGSPNTSSP